MLKLSLMLSILGIVYNCSAVGAEGLDTSIQKILENNSSFQENSKLPSAEEMKKFFYEQVKKLSIFAEPVNVPYAYSKMQPSNFLNNLLNYSKLEPASKYRASKIFEIGMNMPLSSKVSWGAEVSINKNKENYITESKPKQPTAGFRLKPDMYTFQVGLKYKI